ncbi:MULTISPECIES: formylglycine-generating enzyme family protein [Bradyrhizobium]|jgi:formylglycine-generating enzyme required for sulfatase activity|uniref:formylglycine-generating enzyme family protein n=2 Tax=Nitrobacteraceae TaxID=41294 RepID=UPI0003A63995|nr:SUMF1/EgtB/PvdO family nonheme iron enzyme [Bradyrhizobium denitrificans]MCL8487145.1 SUMF1/EgtB/PvdO family nonheme iron enzyme [Bradyrhizobium denitrificans]
MSESSTLQWLRAPRLAEDTLPPESLKVECRRCGRSVQVSLSAMRPPGFLHVDDQVACPEIQERWTGNGSGGLLLMMCGALEQSLDPVSDIEHHEAAVQYEPAPLVAQRIAPQPMKLSPPSWDDSADDQEEAERTGRLHVLLARFVEHRKAFIRVTVGVVALVVVAVGGVLLPLRNLQILIQAPPGLSAVSLQREPLPTSVAVRRTTMDAAAPSTQAPSSQRTPSAPPVAMRQPQAADPLPLPEGPSAGNPKPVVLVDAASAQPKLRVPETVAIPGGTFAMGGEDDSEQPVHQVSIRPFAMGKYPVTVGEWKACVAAGSCADIAAGSDDQPVTNASYDDAQAYLGWLAKVTGKAFRLPTEAEWEYAARAGRRSKYWWGDRMRPGMANCKGCNTASEASDAAQPLKVGSFAANPFGLFDMGGEVAQWVADNWHKSYKGAPADGEAWLDDGSYARVIRSGSWSNGAADARAGSRDRYDGRIRHPTLGFRVALTP